MELPRYPNFCPFCATHVTDGGAGQRHGQYVCGHCHATYRVDWYGAYPASGKAVCDAMYTKHLDPPCHARSPRWLRAARWMLRVPSPRISRAAAVKIAFAEAARRGEPGATTQGDAPKAAEGLRHWCVWFGPERESGRRVIIDNQTGRVRGVGAEG